MRMKKKRHVMQPPYASGDLFAIQIAPDAWGFCRMRRGMGIEIPAVFARAAGSPEMSWTASEIHKWLFYFFPAVREDNPLIVPVGNAPFPSEEEAAMPATYREPDNVEPRYTIEERGIYRYTTDLRDLKGILKRVTLTPATLGTFLREQYHAAALREVGVKNVSRQRG